MDRSQSSGVRTFVLSTLAVLAGGLVFAACGGGGEEQDIIRNFFRASRVDDRGTLGNISMVSFDSREDGTVSDFTIVSVAEDRRTLRVAELSEAVRNAQADEEAHAVEMKEYQDENLEAIARVIEAEREGESVSSADEEVQQMWTEYRETSAQRSQAVSDTEAALSQEGRVAGRSALSSNVPFELGEADAVLVTRDVSITAAVERDGTQTDESMVITLSKVELGSGEDVTEGRWIISAIN